MEISSKEEGRTLTVVLKGELDHHGARGAAEQLDFLLDAALPNTLILDFAAVSFMDSSGIALVLKGHRRMQTLEGKTTVINASPQVKRIFDIAGLSRIVAVK